jgi:hypothetical protein
MLHLVEVDVMKRLPCFGSHAGSVLIWYFDIPYKGIRDLT